MNCFRDILFFYLLSANFFISDAPAYLRNPPPFVTINVGACRTSKLSVCSAFSSASTFTKSTPDFSSMETAIRQFGQVFVVKSMIFSGSHSDPAVLSAVAVHSAPARYAADSFFFFRTEFFMLYSFLSLYSCALPSFQLRTGR